MNLVRNPVSTSVARPETKRRSALLLYHARYDSFGNRWVSANSGFGLASFTPTVSTNFPAKNQLQVQSPTYDSAGNQTLIGAQGSTFDAEGRMVSNTLNNTTNYVYDGAGQRVMKQTASGTTVYVYDAGGNLAAEYMTAQAANPCGTPTCYVSVDQVGSTRLVTDSAGNVARRYDYLPFGEEVPAGTGGRTTAMGYQSQPDGLNPKFTGQYRDTESFLDYFHARYYSPAQGRFVSPDPGNAGADPANPQTWNGYAYVGNNPLIITDSNGEGWLSWLGIGLDIAGAFFGNPLLGGALGMGAQTAATVSTDLLIAGGLATTTDQLINGQPPSALGGGGFSDGSLFGCNGPLGSCGADTGPWSEDSPVFHNAGINPLAVFDLDKQSQLTKDVWGSRVVGWALMATGPFGYGLGANIFVFRMTKSGGPWDFKNQPYRGAHPEFDDFGNCHYGAITHAIGLPDVYARWAAGAASYAAFKAIGKVPPKGWGRPWSGSPWGDNPQNQLQIQIGQETGRCAQ